MQQNIPKHVALIPDGNRRWAKARGLQPWLGHRGGVVRFEEAVEAAFASGVGFLTFWAASLDNLRKRSKREIAFLVMLLKHELGKNDFVKKLQAKEIRFRFIGQWRSFLRDNGLNSRVEALEKRTAEFSRRQLTILFAYDGIQETLDAIRRLIKEKPLPVDYAALKARLWTGGLPPVDLVIRTGGEPHWSAGFMMWLTANSQFYFTKRLWPEFGAKELKRALEDYASRQRRFGS